MSNVVSRMCMAAAFAAGGLFAGSAPAAVGPNLLELDGNIVEGAGGCPSGNGCPTAPLSGVPDWSSLFTTTSCPHGNVTGTSLPAEGRIAAFGRDDISVGNLTDCTKFAGSNKNIDPIHTWEFEEGNVPAKDDISNVYAYLAESGDRVLYLGLERISVNGDAHADFEINAGEIGQNPALGTCSDGSFTGGRLVGDLLIVADFVRGGGVGEVRIFRYVKNDADLGSNETNDPELLYDSGDLGDVSSFCNAAGTLPADTICVANNSAAIDGGPWLNREDHGNNTVCIPRNAFTEVAINLSQLPGGLGVERCVSSITTKTRTSQSISSELKDFDFIQFDTCSDIRGTKREACNDPNACGEPSCDNILRVLENWEIRLLDGDGDLVQFDGEGNDMIATGRNPVCTDENGNYEFANLRNGDTYQVCEVIPDRAPGENFEWRSCFPSPGERSDSSGASHCPGQYDDREAFCHPEFALNIDKVQDFTNFKRVLICDFSVTKFCDEDGDGTRDPEDSGRDGFCVCIEPTDDSPMPNAKVCGVTELDGDFTVEVARGYAYRVSEDLDGSSCGSADRSAGWVQTTPAANLEIAVPAVGAPCGAEIGNASIPTIDCGAGNTTIDAGGDCTAEFCFTPTATNECGDVTVSCTATNGVTLTPTSGGSGVQRCGVFPGPTGGSCAQTTTVTCTATTDAGQTATCSFTVTVEDNEAPVITCDTPTGDDLNGDCEATVTFTATVTDNCCLDAGEAADFTCALSVLSGSADLGAETCVPEQVSDREVRVTGTRVISDPGGCPRFQTLIDAKDCCGNDGDACTKNLRTDCSIVPE